MARLAQLKLVVAADQAVEQVVSQVLGAALLVAIMVLEAVQQDQTEEVHITLAALVVAEQSVLSGLEHHALSHQPIRVIYNGFIIYQGSRRSTSRQPSLREQPYSGLWLRAA
jgi:hypothetical protein